MADNQPTLSDFEEWRDVPGYEGYYQVSDHGRVRSLDRVVTRSSGWDLPIKGRIMSPHPHPAGHLLLHLSKNGKRFTAKVHRLVLEAFVGPCPDGMVCCHNDGNPANNHVSNLRWDTLSSNRVDDVKHGKNHEANKTHCPYGHALESPNLALSVMHRGRSCKACHRARARVQDHQHLKPHYQKVSDSYYQSIMAGTDGPSKECHRGHLLEGANLVPSGLTKGKRQCLACKRGRDHVSRGKYADVQAATDVQYEQIMGRAAA